jgi:hypothetical protein
VTFVVHSQRSGSARQWAVELSCALCCVLCALCTRAPSVCAQAATVSAVGHGAPPTADAAPPALLTSPADVRLELSSLRGELDAARFSSVEARTKTLLAAPTLRAQERNDALELLAIAQIAARADAAAEGTLRELFARDPEHVAHVRDPGPNVAAMFERVRSQKVPPTTVPITVSALRDAQGRVIVELALGVGHDAVDSVHVFARPSGAALGDGASAGTADETSHVVADVGARTALAVALPPAPQKASAIALYVEGRAPSGAVLGRDGSERAPLLIRLEPAAPACADVPLRRRWWVWTSVALVVSGVAISAALAAH